MLKDFPQQFVKLIAAGMLFVTAPRIKKAADYWMEEETRTIIPLPAPDYNTLINGYDETISKFGLNPQELRSLVASEKTRQRQDGSTVYYREMHLPIHLLKTVYARSSETKNQVETFLKSKELDVQVKQI